MATLDTQTGMRRRDGHDSTRARSGADLARPARAGWIFLQRVLLVLALALFLALVVLPRLGLYRPVTVLSGSMRPTFSPGDMIVVAPEPVSAVRVGARGRPAVRDRHAPNQPRGRVVIASFNRRAAACALALALALALVGMLALVGAPLASAVFSVLKTAGPMTLAAGTLDAPNSPGATQFNCRINKSPEVKLEWIASESSYATSYNLERRTGTSGSFEVVATVSASQTSYTDKSASLNYSTTYYYRVATVYRSWTANSVLASVKTLSKSCA